ncbi:MAG: GDP-mannose 4,6-dehydratase [Candidatus Omnitrophica bacterium]|nr:GDP-mannose 4,6-dehydratase [Candidatus Omnitrophota bacterium]
MRVLVTGLTGFVGSHLADFLLAQGGVELYGTERIFSNDETLAKIRRRARLYVCDVCDAEQVKSLVEEVLPDRIFHLAAQTFVPVAWQKPQETLTTNVAGALNLFEVVRRLGLQPTIVIVGSSEQYGAVLPSEIPITEDVPFRPLNPYGVSKAAQDLLGYQYHRSFGLKIIRIRGFSHTGPRQKEGFAASNFARQIALIEADRQEPVIYVGNLDTVRDFTDVRDMVRAYWLAGEKGMPGEVYNVCSGVGRTIQEIMDIYLKHSRVKFKVEKDPERVRSSDIPIVIGDSTKFRRQTGWQPAIPFERTLLDLLNDWREKIAVTAVQTKISR